jgi:mannose-6-phosphate isomerase-like protein (cupin superfamily)
VTRVERGRLEDPGGAPAVGERFLELASFPAATIEQILSGTLVEPASFDQPHDEWVVLLAGGARMLVEGEELELRAGDWLLIPAGCPHTVLETQRGSSWLAVHITGRS